jgi:hypothetical protein
MDTPISITSCTGTTCAYSKNGGEYTSLPGTVASGDTVKVHETSSGSLGTTADLILNIGGTEDTFSVTTIGELALTLPSLLTNPATLIKKNSVVLNGVITGTGGENARVRGFEYGLTTDYGSNISEDGLFGTGSFSKKITSTSCNKTYHYRSYAGNSVGTNYGEDVSFTSKECNSSSGSSVESTRSPEIQNEYFPIVPKPNIAPTEGTEKSHGSKSASSILVSEKARILKQGIRGNDVSELQNYLNNHGFQCGLADGIFGPKTKAAVVEFQLANGLVKDGIVGPKTKEKIK